MILECDITLCISFNIKYDGKGKEAERRETLRRWHPNKTSCGNNSSTQGITMHQFPTDPVVRAQWFHFVQKYRVDFGEPLNKYACLCSAHVKENSFMHNQSILASMATSHVRRVLVKGSEPTRDKVLLPSAEYVLTERNKRKVKVVKGVGMRPNQSDSSILFT